MAVCYGARARVRADQDHHKRFPQGPKMKARLTKQFQRIIIIIIIMYTPGSMNRLFGDFFRDFWPGFLALDQNGDGTDGRDGRTEYSFTVLLGRRNTVYSSTGTEKYSVQFYWDRKYSVQFFWDRKFRKGNFINRGALLTGGRGYTLCFSQFSPLGKRTGQF